MGPGTLLTFWGAEVWRDKLHSLARLGLPAEVPVLGAGPRTGFLQEMAPSYLSVQTFTR